MKCWPHQQIRTQPKPVAIITTNPRGGVSLIVPEAGKAIGNYDTPERASEVAVLNGYDPHIENLNK